MTHILIIEDELLVSLDLQACFEEAGATSSAIASSEDDAVDLALQQRPDLIASDVRLAQGSGPSAVRRILDYYGEIPVVYITGNPEAVRLSQPDAWIIVKPYRRDQLKSAVQTHCLSDPST